MIEEAPRTPSVQEVCVIEGAGRGECWACPVRECVLWQDPRAVLSDATLATLAKAIARLKSKDFRVRGVPADFWDSPDAVLELLGRLAESDTQDRLLVEMAAEASVQGLLGPLVEERQRRAESGWWSSLGARTPQPEDHARLDETLAWIAARAAAPRYGIKSPELVRLVAQRIVELRHTRLRHRRPHD